MSLVDSIEWRIYTRTSSRPRIAGLRFHIGHKKVFHLPSVLHPGLDPASHRQKLLENCVECMNDDGNTSNFCPLQEVSGMGLKVEKLNCSCFLGWCILGMHFLTKCFISSYNGLK